MSLIEHIVIVGGGTAGWITAGTIASSTKARHRQPLHVTLVESPDIPIIGVGEGTWPTLRRTLKAMGVREAEFLSECHATFKQGAKFARWVTGEESDFYYHPLVLPQGYFETNLVRHWQAHRSELGPFSGAVCPQDALCEAGLAPKQIATSEFGSLANYAYHLDAGKFSTFLQRHCTEKLGVRHVLANLTAVNASDNGDIASIECDRGGEIKGDLFIDCTGARSLLLGQHYQVPFKGCRDTLFIDRAIACQVSYPDDTTPIASHTISTAQKVGWIWDIGLPHRRGVGHVYSSAHCNEADAAARLENYLEATSGDPTASEFRSITIEPGHRTKFWEKNCVAVGLSAGFLEPLEASAILLIEIAAQFIADEMPVNRDAMEIVARRFNRTFEYRWERIIDFLKLHYVLSQRTDDQFWIDNRDAETIPDSLRELLQLWRHQPPWHDDFDRAVEVFPAASYQYVLYGMGFRTEPDPRGLSLQHEERASELLEKNRREIVALTRDLPKNRELLAKISRYGLPRV